MNHDLTQIFEFTPDRWVYNCSCGRMGTASGAHGGKNQFKTLEEKARANHFKHKIRAVKEGRRLKLGRPTKAEKAAMEAAAEEKRRRDKERIANTRRDRGRRGITQPARPSPKAR